MKQYCGKGTTRLRFTLKAFLKRANSAVASQLACISGVTGDEQQGTYCAHHVPANKIHSTSTRKLLLDDDCHCGSRCALNHRCDGDAAFKSASPAGKGEPQPGNGYRFGYLEKPYHVGGDISAPKLVYFSNLDRH